MDEKLGLLKGMIRISIFRDLNYLLAGVFILIIVNLIFNPSFNSYPNMNYFGPTGRYVGICIIAYFLARILNQIGGLIIKLFFIFFQKDYKKSFNHLEEYYNLVSEFNGKESEVIDLKISTIFHLETAQYLHDKPEMYSLCERSAQKLMYETIALGFSFVLLFLTNYHIINFIVFISLLLLSVKTKLMLNGLYSKINVLIAREKQGIIPF